MIKIRQKASVEIKRHSRIDKPVDKLETNTYEAIYKKILKIDKSCLPILIAPLIIPSQNVKEKLQ